MNAPTAIKTDIHARMILIMRDLEAIGKDKKNESQGFKYRGIDDLYNALHPILSRHGVFMGAEVVSKTREERTNAKGTVLAFTCLRMRYRFTSEDGSTFITEAEGEGMDSGDKSSNKAMAVAHKYALLQTFCIPTLDLDDPDAHTHEVAAKPSPPPQDQDAIDGINNWLAKQKAVISAATGLPALYLWLDEIASIEGVNGDMAKPDSGTPLDRLKRKVPEAYREISLFYQAKVDALSKK